MRHSLGHMIVYLNFKKATEKGPFLIRKWCEMFWCVLKNLEVPLRQASSGGSSSISLSNAPCVCGVCSPGSMVASAVF